MDAIQMLEEQHREVAELFKKISRARSPKSRADLFAKIGDALAIHATIEEKHFYPAVKERRTEDILLESLEEPLAIKRVLADLLDTSPDDETFKAKVKVLQELVEHHVEEEQDDLFPKVKKIMDDTLLEAIGQEMQATMTELEGKDPRYSVRRQTEEAAPLEPDFDG